MVSIKTTSFYVLLALFIAALSAGTALLVREKWSGSPGVEILLPTTTPTPELKVYVSGAVAAPGVYGMKEGDRLEDALSAAGGATHDAQLSCINLAVRVRDEAQLHVPGTGEPCQPAFTAATTQDDSRIDLNTAAVEQLETLPDIGKVKAQAIVDYRERNGPSQSIYEVMDVRGIGPAIYEGIRNLVQVGGVSP